MFGFIITICEKYYQFMEYTTHAMISCVDTVAPCLRRRMGPGGPIMVALGVATIGTGKLIYAKGIAVAVAGSCLLHKICEDHLPTYSGDLNLPPTTYNVDPPPPPSPPPPPPPPTLVKGIVQSENNVSGGGGGGGGGGGSLFATE